MFVKKMILPLALLFVVCADAAVAQDTPARRAQTDLAYAFALGGGGNHLGVSVESVTRENMNSFNLRGGEPRGVAVRDVLADSPAAKAGLQKNDVILRFDGEPVSSAQKLQRLINESAPEHTARLSISRNGAEQELSVTLGKRAAENFSFPKGEAFGFNSDEFKRNAEQWKRNSDEWKKRAKELELNSQDLRKNMEKFRAEGFGNNFTLAFSGGGRRIGIATQALTDQLADYFGVGASGGLLVTSVSQNSPAAKAGLKAGDIITEVDGARLKTAGELTRALNRKDEGEVTINITRDRKTRTVKVTPERSQNPTLFTPGSGGIGFVAPMALLAPRASGAPRPAMPAMPRRTPVAPVSPVTPRPNAAPRIYVTPAIPSRSGVWML